MVENFVGAGVKIQEASYHLTFQTFGAFHEQALTGHRTRTEKVTIGVKPPIKNRINS